MSHPPDRTASLLERPGAGRTRPCRPSKRVLWICFGLLATSTPALAQDERPTGYPRSANERDGKPVEFSAVYTAELRANVNGGVEQGARYLDNLDLQVAVDAERVLGWRGARLFAYAIYNNGRSLSELAGDFQTISNIETGIRAARLFEAWIEQDLGGRGSLKAGLYNLNSEFDTTQSGGLFLLSSHGIGPDFSQSGRSGPSIFPKTSLALRGEAALDGHWLVRAAILDGVPGDPDHPRRTAIKLSAQDGALLVAELNYLRGGTKAGIGTWGYTARFDPITSSNTPLSGRGNKGAYIFAEHRLIGDRGDDAAGLAGWLRFGLADARYNPVHRYIGGGLVYSGLSKSRGDDQIGLSFALADFGRRYRAAQRNEGVDAGGREIVFEAVYNAVLTSWLSAQPDVQYIIGPSGNHRVRDAVVIGVRLKIGR